MVWYWRVLFCFYFLYFLSSVAWITVGEWNLQLSLKHRTVKYEWTRKRQTSISHDNPFGPGHYFIGEVSRPADLISSITSWLYRCRDMEFYYYYAGHVATTRVVLCYGRLRNASRSISEPGKYGCGEVQSPCGENWWKLVQTPAIFRLVCRSFTILAGYFKSWDKAAARLTIGAYWLHTCLVWLSCTHALTLRCRLLKATLMHTQAGYTQTPCTLAQ